jgi:hypothetical protein
MKSRTRQFRGSLLFIWVCLVSFSQAQTQRECSRGTPIAFESDGLAGFVSDQGVVIAPQFKSVGFFSDGYSEACTEMGCGYIDIKGRFVTPLCDPKKGSSIDPVPNRLRSFELSNGLSGYVDSSGGFVIAPQFEYAGEFHDGIAAVVKQNRRFFIDRTGKRITPEFDSVSDFSEDLAAVEVDSKMGYIRRDGSFALPPRFRGTSDLDFSEGLVAIRIEGKVGFMNKSGTIVIEPAYDDAYEFSEGRAVVQSGDKFGYIDAAGNLVIPLRFPIAHTFAEGLASVQLSSGKWGYIDRAVAFVIPPLFDAAMPFCAGVAAVETRRVVGRTPCRSDRYTGRHGMIDQSGKYVWREKTDRVWDSPYCF